MAEQAETTALEALLDGDAVEWDRIVPLVYTELRAIAHRQLQRERDSHTLNTTALVHEAYLRLANQPGIRCESEAHLFGIAARVMRQVLVDYARHRGAAKRRGAQATMDLESVGLRESSAGAAAALLADERAERLIALDDALVRLAMLDVRLVRVVECRFFADLTEEETASALGVTARTVRRDWMKAKAWLQRELER